MDVTNAADIAAAAEQCTDVTLLINNAGIYRNTAFLTPGSADAARAELETNFFGPLALSLAFAPVLKSNGGGAIVNVLSVLSWLNISAAATYSASKSAAWSLTNGLRGELRPQGTQAVLPHMRAQRSGRIVNVCSVLGFLPASYMGLYSATKRAVEGMSETLDQEVRQFGVRVSLVEPGFTKSKLVSSAVAKNVGTAPGPEGVATTIVAAALGAWRLRHTPKGQASLLAKLRRFMPAGPVDQSLRKSFGLS